MISSRSGQAAFSSSYRYAGRRFANKFRDLRSFRSPASGRLFRRKLIPAEKFSHHRRWSPSARHHFVFAVCDRLIRQRYSVHIDGRAAHQKLCIFQGKIRIFQPAVSSTRLRFLSQSPVRFRHPESLQFCSSSSVILSAGASVFLILPSHTAEHSPEHVHSDAA